MAYNNDTGVVLPTSFDERFVTLKNKTLTNYLPYDSTGPIWIIYTILLTRQFSSLKITHRFLAAVYY